jgi:hypothetical protein
MSSSDDLRETASVIEAVVPSIVERGAGGSIVITSSAAGLKVLLYDDAWVNPGRSLVPLRSMVWSGSCKAPMIRNEAVAAFSAQFPDYTAAFKNTLPVDVLDPVDIPNAIVYLASDAARYVTGVIFPVDGGVNAR